MPTYTTTTNLEIHLPAGLPASITTAMKTQWIADASALVDALVGPRYPMLSTGQKFPNISASPATPPLIELCARWLAAHYGFLKLGEINRSEPTMATKYLEMARAQLQEIREGEANIYDSTGADLASAETAWSSTKDRDAVFTVGEYVDGDLQGDEGTLDDFGLS